MTGGYFRASIALTVNYRLPLQEFSLMLAFATRLAQPSSTLPALQTTFLLPFFAFSTGQTYFKN